MMPDNSRACNFLTHNSNSGLSWGELTIFRVKFANMLGKIACSGIQLTS